MPTLENIYEQAKSLQGNGFFLHETHISDDGHHSFLYDSNKNHRFIYSLTWDNTKPIFLWIMLNPGTGETEMRRRPTFEKCKLRSIKSGAGGIIFCNLYTLRTKSAKLLAKLIYTENLDLFHNLNIEIINICQGISSQVICAWGGAIKNPIPSGFFNNFNGAVCLGLTKSGMPRHPLYVPMKKGFIDYLN